MSGGVRATSAPGHGWLVAVVVGTVKPHAAFIVVQSCVENESSV
jgi:hypothetical protein